MRVTENKRFLEFDLKDGWRYQERGDSYAGGHTEFIRISFSEYKKQFDLSSFQINWTPDSVNRNNEKMFSMRQLVKAIDSLEKEIKVIRNQAHDELARQIPFEAIPDSAWTEEESYPIRSNGKWRKISMRSYRILPVCISGCMNSTTPLEVYTFPGRSFALRKSPVTPSKATNGWKPTVP